MFSSIQDLPVELLVGFIVPAIVVFVALFFSPDLPFTAILGAFFFLLLACYFSVLKEWKSVLELIPFLDGNLYQFLHLTGTILSISFLVCFLGMCISQVVL
ncbi:MAG: hypothetical protein Kow0069_34360 [Promethearchaeota archaeon]